MKKLAKTIEDWKRIYDEVGGEVGEFKLSLILKELKKLAS